ncbi:hypothetical protein JXJ21_16230 [candidate division KSB1 bacterium]|nr:hypothetical protein [candidate division KSB1 bacterium]
MAGNEHPGGLYTDILEKLNRLRIKLKTFDFINQLLLCCVVLLLVTFVFSTVEIIFRIGIAERIIIAGLGFLSFIAVVSFFVLRPLYGFFFQRQSPDDDTLALRVGQKFPHIKDKLINSLQVFKKHQQNPEGYSPALIDASLYEIVKDIRNVNFDEVIEYKPIKRQLRRFGLVIGMWLIIGLLFFQPYQAAGVRLLHPFTDYQNGLSYKFTILPGNIEIIKGENINLSARIEGEEYIGEARLVYTNLTSQNRIERKLTASQGGRFSYTIESVKDSLEYFFIVGDISSPKHRVSVLELPMVRNLQIKLTYPSYTQMPAQFLDENIGDFAALKGTQIQMKIRMNKPVANVNVVFDDSSQVPMKITENEALATWTLKRSGQYFFGLVDKQGNRNENPIEYRMDIIEDQYPAVKITIPATDVDLGDDMQLFLVAEAQDDFGFLSARLNYRIYKTTLQTPGDSQSVQLTLPQNQQESITIEYQWNLSGLGLLPSDYASYNIEVFDNDIVSGPKSSRSLTYTVRFPSMFEMYSELNKQQQETSEDFEKMYQQSKELKEKLSNIVEEMKKDPQLNWEERKNIEEALESQKDAQEKLQDIENKLDEIVKRAEKNDLLALETLEKYKELQELFKELAPPELKKAMDELNRALENMDPNQLQQAVQKFNMSQEDFLKSIERTLTMLKRLQIEQRFDEAIKKAEELARQQNELNKQSQDASQKEAQDLAKQQQDLQKDAETLQKDIDELKNRMAQFPDMPLDKMQSTSEIMRQQQIAENMQFASQKLQQGEMKSANRAGKMAENSLMELVEALKSTKQQMDASQKQQVMQALQRLTRDLLSLSMEQESLMGKADNLHQNSNQYNKLAEKQQNLLGGLERTAENLMSLSQKTFFVTPEIGKAIGKSYNQMQKSLENLEERRGTNATQSQGMAMVALNEAVKQMRDSMQNLSGASSAMGMEQFMQQLQSMAGRQQGINQQTMQLGAQGQLSMQQQAAMARLAAEQQALRKSLEQLQGEMGNRSEILGRLDEVAKDMSDVAKQLARNQVDRRTIQRQQRILSRLLDASRSMRQEDFSRQRKAETAKQYLPRTDVKLPANMGELKKKLHEDLLQALKEGYSRDYRELIKLYFEALSRNTNDDASETN